ncbi:MAG: sterol desaturase family protein [Pseudomonadota bacterium]
MTLVLSDQFLMTLLLVPVIILAEAFWPARKVPAKHYFFDIGYWAANLVLMAFVAPLLATAIALGVQNLGAGFIKLGDLGLSGFGAALFALLVTTFISDFFYYWFHRLLHHNPILWQTHLLHHSDEHMNTMTAPRSHFTETMLSPLFIALPMAILFDLPPITVGVLSLLPAAYHFFSHANVKCHYGPLWWVLISPSYHRIHHSIELRHRDKNFANWFPFWDIVFGTAYRPKKDEYPETGVDGVEVKTLSQAFLLPFTQWWKMARN